MTSYLFGPQSLSRFRRLRLEPLESRAMLTTFTVSTLVDESDGNFADGDQSLREAIERANLDATPDVINFKAGLTGIITLTGTGLVISKDLSITGPGANLLTVSGGNSVRVFYVTDAGNPLTVSMSGFAIANGSIPGFAGGGIATDAGSDLTLNRMYLHDNTADQGGGIAAINARLTILNSTIALNQASIIGGGIYHDGAGAHDTANPTLRVINSTIWNNRSTTDGGGVYVFDGAAQFRNSSVVWNVADSDQANGGVGGGVWTYNDSATSSTLYNTIFAGNAISNTPNDIANKNVETACRHNLIGDALSAGGLSHGNNGNLVGNAGSGTIDIYTVVAPDLDYYGGSTPTVPLITGSPALDAGDDALALDQNGAPLTADQRGFTRKFDGPDVDAIATVDIGSYEATRRTLTVDTLHDGFDSYHESGTLSLREALRLTNDNAGADTINFTAALSGVVHLIGEQLLVRDSVAINGPGADKLAIDAGQASRIISISAGVVWISGLELRDGKALEGQSGGAIFARGGADVTLDRLYLHDNVSTVHGGAIHLGRGTLRISNSTLSKNIANSGSGGAIMAEGASLHGPATPDLKVINCTLSGNSAFAGAGIFVVGAAAEIRNSTVTKNNAVDLTETELAGGVHTGSGSSYTTLFNSLVAGNTSDATPFDVGGLALQANSQNNLIGDSATAGGLSNGDNGNIVGNDGTGTIDIATVLNANLAFNGGTTPTHLPVAGGPAIDNGNNSLALDRNGAALTSDQRGATRIIDRDNDGVATVDIGAVELRPFSVALSGTITYTENAAPLILASGATLSALDSKTFNTGKLTVTNAVSPHADDRLIVRHEGSAAGQVAVSGSEVRYGGVLIGTKTGGGGSTPLVVTFNGNATAAAVQAVVRRIAFSSVSDNPPTAARSIRFAVKDGQGSFSKTVTKTVNVVRVNDPPVIASFGSVVTYIEDNATVGVAVAAAVSDVDSFTFDEGKLSARISANAESSDRLTIRNSGGVSTSSNEITIGGEVIGTFTGGSGGTALVVTFNGLANAADVQAVLRAVAYRNISQNPSSKTRTLSVFITDGDGGTSATSTKSINVEPENDVPILGSISGSVGYARDSAAIILAGSATVSDLDSDNFDGGRLRVRIGDGASSSNRLAIGSGFTIDGSNNVMLNGAAIGTRVSSGFGTSELVVTFKAAATKTIVQQLIRAITFKTVGGAAGQRKVIFTVSDGDGGLSAEVFKTVNVT